MTRDYSRLLKPRSVALLGSENWCRDVISNLREMGYVWDIWPVVPGERTVGGLRAFAAVEGLPDEALSFLGGSRYVETDLISQEAWDRFGGMKPGWGRVQAIVDHVHGRIRFDYQQARATRTATQANSECVGVCRDFAHLALAYLRALNIPARYVNGYVGDIGVPADSAAMDFAAWIEVFLGGRWWTFDPRNNQRRIGRVVVARGHDAADVPLMNSFGQHVLESFRVWCHPVDGSGRELDGMLFA